MPAELITIGTELLLGQIVDTNSAWLGEHLQRLGVPVQRTITVGDRMDDIVDAILTASRRADIIVTTGGLGPTDDDLTREATARALQVPLVRDPELVDDIRAFFERRGRSMPPANARQADRPEGATPIRNPVGTAPAFAVQIGEAMLFALPGVPREMRHLFQTELTPRLAGVGEPLVVRTLHTVGIGESTLMQRLEGLPTGEDPRESAVLGTLAHDGQVDLRLMASARTEAAANDRIAPIEAEIRDRLGVAIFGADGTLLSDAVSEALAGRSWTLAVAETHTGGALARRLIHGGQLLRATVVPPSRMRELPGTPDSYTPDAATAAARAVAAEAGTDVGLVLLGEAGEGIGPHAARAGEAVCGVAWPGGQASGQLTAGATAVACGWSVGRALGVMWGAFGTPERTRTHCQE